MVERLETRPRPGSRRIPEVDPSVRRRFEALELGRRRPSERLRVPTAEEVRSLSIPHGDGRVEERARLHPRWVLLLLLVLLVAVVAHGLWSGRPLWTVQTLTAQGNRSIETGELLQTLGLAPGMSWWRAGSVDRGVAKERFPRLASLSFGYRFPQGLTLTVTEREPVLRWLSGSPRVVSADGVLLNIRPDLDPSDLPCLTAEGQATPAVGDRLDLPDAGDWFGQLETVRREQPELWASISQIQYEDGRRFRIFLRDPKRVLVWDPHLNEHLWERVPWVLEDLARRGVGTDAVLDLRFRDRIVVRIPEEEWQRLQEGMDGATNTGNGPVLGQGLHGPVGADGPGRLGSGPSPRGRI